ncbi:MAG: hypothetical protein PVF82_12600 [Gammaproteobacteria bacterium]|jgi:hypothetical protein
MRQAYRPSQSIYRNSILLAYEVDDTAELNIMNREHIDFESEDFEGENGHPTKIIVKSNEPGAYGLGRMRQGITNKHVTNARYATKKEVAKALKLNVIEVSDAYKPPTGWQ